MPWHLDAANALSLIATCTAFSVLLSSLELFYLAGKGEFAKGGAWDWDILKSVSSPRSRYFDFLMKGPHGFTALLLTRSSAAFLLTATGLESPLALIALLALVVSQVILNNRLIWGDDGSDQMISLLLIALFLYKIAGSGSKVATMTVLFIAAQLVLSYVSSGIAKVFGTEWRRGTALQSIMGHHTYGNRRCHEFLNKYPQISRLASYGAIVFMVTFPLYFFLPSKWAWLYLVSGVSFHVSVSALMRLNGFLSAFISGYPALVAAHHLLYRAF